MIKFFFVDTQQEVGHSLPVNTGDKQMAHTKGPWRPRRYRRRQGEQGDAAGFCRRMPVSKFYTFRQNNSGGSFYHDPKAGIGFMVCVEAENADDANRRAEKIGLYFDGCDTGLDCPCCGDRWSEQWTWDEPDDGTEKPEPIEGGWGIPAYIHYMDGRVKKVRPR